MQILEEIKIVDDCVYFGCIDFDTLLDFCFWVEWQREYVDMAQATLTIIKKFDHGT